MLLLPPTATNLPEWIRKAAGVINELIRARNFPFPPGSSDPTNPQAGQVYYNTTTNKARAFNGSAWFDLW